MLLPLVLRINRAPPILRSETPAVDSPIGPLSTCVPELALNTAVVPPSEIPPSNWIDPPLPEVRPSVALLRLRLLRWYTTFVVGAAKRSALSVPVLLEAWITL